MSKSVALKRELLYAVALIFCLLSTAYSVLWMTDTRRLGHAVELGFNIGRDTTYSPTSHSIRVYNVAPRSPAERAGLQPKDQIIGLNGSPLTSYEPFDRIWTYSSPGDAIELTVRREGSGEPIILHGVFQSTRLTRPAESFARTVARQLTGSVPVLFLLVGFAVLFSRIEDPYAWLLALLFCCMITVPSFSNNMGMYPRIVRIFVNAFRGGIGGMLAACFYTFFALFPQRSSLDRRAPWLRWLAWLFAASLSLPGLVSGDVSWPNESSRVLGGVPLREIRLTIIYGFLGLGLVSLILNSYSKEVEPQARRKALVLFWGTLIGILPASIDRIAADFFTYEFPFWVDKFVVLTVIAYPLSFAYAIVRYRVLEIPALLRRSARYVLVQRGYTTLLFCGAVLAVALFARFFSGSFAKHSELAMVFSAIFGVALVWASGPIVKRGTQRIDRAFFRSAYDTKVILQDLAEQTKRVTSREHLADLLCQELGQALHPKSLAFFFRDENGRLQALGANNHQLVLPYTLPFVERLRITGHAWDVPPPSSPEYPPEFPLGALAPECIVPLIERDGLLIGLFVLGQ